MTFGMLLWIAAASAGELLPWAAPWDVQMHYDHWRASKGEPARALACEPLWPDTAQLCLRREDEGRLRRVHADEGKVDRAALTEGAEAWIRAELEVVQVDGMEAEYRLLRDARGRAALGVMAPGALGADLGTPFLAALPSSGILVAWKGGDPHLDKVMAVAVRELHDGAKDRVSPVVWGWDGKRWFPFVEAKPEEPQTPGPKK